MPSRKVKERIVYESPWWRMYDDETVGDEGESGTYSWARTTSGLGAVMVAPRTPDRRLLLIKVRRYPIDDYLWEFVAGLAEEGELPEETARRELLEETGLEAGEVRYLGRFSPISGFIGDWFHSLVAEVPEIALEDLSLEEEEGIIDARLVTPVELRGMVASGEIVDGVTLTLTARLWADSGMD